MSQQSLLELDGGTGCALAPLRNPESLEYQPALVLQRLEPVFERKPAHYVNYGSVTGALSGTE